MSTYEVLLFSLLFLNNFFTHINGATGKWFFFGSLSLVITDGNYTPAKSYKHLQVIINLFFFFFNYYYYYYYCCGQNVFVPVQNF